MLDIRIAVLLLAACSTQATTDGSTDIVEQAELDALAAQIVALQTRLDDAEASVSALEQQAAEDQARIDELEAAVGTGTSSDELEGRVSALETDLGALEGTVDALGARVDEVVDALGNQIWSLQSEGDGSGGKGSDFSAIGAGVDLSVTSTEPILAWCVAQSYEGTPSLRLTITSADGSWTTSGTEVTIDENPGMKIYLTAIASFTPPAAGDYTLDCEGKRGTTWYDYDVLAIQGVPSL